MNDLLENLKALVEGLEKANEQKLTLESVINYISEGFGNGGLDYSEFWDALKRKCPDITNEISDYITDALDEYDIAKIAYKNGIIHKTLKELVDYL
jgi:hypothetical protein